MSRKIITGAKIALRSGNYFDFQDPETSFFTVDDVAHGLAHICRFGGQTSRFYSVAQHSVHVSEVVPAEHAFAALLHDAAEFVIGDVRKPVKAVMPGFAWFEDRIERAILGSFGLSKPLHPSIKEADLLLVATEQVQLMNNRDQWETTQGREPLDLELPFWDPEEAKERFLLRFIELSGRNAA